MINDMNTKSIFFFFTLALIGISFQSQAQHIDTNYGEFVDPRDNQMYKTVKIGEQVWFAENFAYMPYVCSPDSSNCGIWVYSYYGNNVSEAKETPEYEKYGALYSWSEARDLAPEGWHLPSDEEWKELEKHLGISSYDIENKEWRGENNEADQLKTGGETGLGILFGGWMTDYGEFRFIKEHANFWCSTEFDDNRGFERLVGVNNGKIGRAAGNKGCGFSVRYIKN